MRVLVLSCATYADPATRRVWDRVASRGIEVVLAMPRRIEHPFGPAIVPDTPWPSPVRLVRLDTWYRHHNGTHIVMKGIPRLVRETRPDLIHCVMEPWSITCLETLAVLPTMSPRPLFGVQAAEIKLAQGNPVAAALRKTLFRTVVSRCDFFAGWSPLVLEAAISLGLNGHPAGAVPAVGIDADLLRPAEPEQRRRIREDLDLAAADEFLVGFVGRFVEEKGVGDLVAAMDVAVRRMPGMRLALMGGGPLQPRLLDASASRPWLRLLPRSDRAGVARFLRGLDLLLLASRSTTMVEEQFGLVLAEAMASGVPAAGSRCGAIPYVIGDDAWTFAQGDIEAITNLIVSAATHRDATARAGLAARERTLARFSDEAIAQSLTSLWRSIP